MIYSIRRFSESQKEFGDTWNKFKHYAPSAIKGGIKGAIPGAILGLTAVGSGSGKALLTGASIGASLGAILGGKIAMWWKGKYESPEDKKKWEELVSSLEWVTKIGEKYQEKIKKLNKDLERKNKTIHEWFYIPSPDFEVLGWHKRDKIILVGGLDSNPDDNIYPGSKNSLLLLYDVDKRILYDAKSDGSVETIITSEKQLSKMIKDFYTPSPRVSDFELKELLENLVTRKELDDYTNLFNQKLRQI